jgi:hypothetical protein
MALDSPLNKIKSILDKLEKGLFVEKNAYIANIAKLQETIESVKNEILNIASSSKEIKNISHKKIKELKIGLKKESKKKIKLLQDEYSVTISEKIKSTYTKRKDTLTYKASIGEGEEVFGGKIKKKIFEQLEKLEEEGILELEKKEEAENIKKTLNTLLQNEVEKFYISSEKELNSGINILSNTLNKTIQKKLGSTLHILEEKFGKDFIIDLPQINLDIKNIEEDTEIESLYFSKNKTTYQKSKKLYKKFFGWFNTDWGYDKIDVTVYIIKKTEIQEKSKKVLEKALEELNKLIDDTITNKVDIKRHVSYTYKSNLHFWVVGWCFKAHQKKSISLTS